MTLALAGSGVWLAFLILAASLFAVIIIGQQTLRLATGNFHTVVEGELYRSAQPNRLQLLRVARRHKIRTVVNLRGPRPGTPWYDEERQAAREAGVTLIDFRMSSSRVWTFERQDQLLDILRKAQKPVLIHCRAGSDRTGLASLLYAYEIAGMDKKAARKHLGFSYGHYSIPRFSPSYAMDLTWQVREATQRLQEM